VFAIADISESWSFFSLKRETGIHFIDVVQDGVLVENQASADTLGGTSVTLAAGNAPYDLRIKPGLIDDAALNYYRADVLAGGVKCLPS
jgi:hypothetical protein